MLKAIFKGGDFQCSQGNGTIIFELADNSSKLIFGPDGSIASLISSDILENNYLNGGIDLGNFDFMANSTIVNGLNNILNNFTDDMLLIPYLHNYFNIWCIENLNLTYKEQVLFNFTSDLVIGLIGSWLLVKGFEVGFELSYEATPFIGIPIGFLISSVGIILICESNDLIEQPNNATRISFTMIDLGGVGISGTIMNHLYRNYALRGLGYDVFDIILNFFNNAVISTYKLIFGDN